MVRRPAYTLHLKQVWWGVETVRVPAALSSPIQPQHSVQRSERLQVGGDADLPTDFLPFGHQSLC